MPPAQGALQAPKSLHCDQKGHSFCSHATLRVADPGHPLLPGMPFTQARRSSKVPFPHVTLHASKVRVNKVTSIRYCFTSKYKAFVFENYGTCQASESCVSGAAGQSYTLEDRCGIPKSKKVVFDQLTSTPQLASTRPSSRTRATCRLPSPPSRRCNRRRLVRR